MDWDLEVKRIISDSIDTVVWVMSPKGKKYDCYVGTKIVDNKLILSISHIERNEGKDFEVILKEIDVNQ